MENNQLISETLSVSQNLYPILITNEKEISSSKPFIEANTIDINLSEIKQNHIIPVFVKDNEPLISQSDFIDITYEVVSNYFSEQDILQPNVRVSHPIKGRIPEAKDKPAIQLKEWEKTIYYERMMFAIEIPSIKSCIDGNNLSLTIGGVKAFNNDNLYSRSQSEQHFKLFIGFKNSVCTNLCVWSDGLMSDLKVKTIEQLRYSIYELLERYNNNHHLFHLNKLTEYDITERQFAQLIGRCRMYPYLTSTKKSEITPILLGDQQMNMVVKEFYRDDNFCCDTNGNINLWKLYNLFTGANKSSYIDSFLERGNNVYQLVEQLRWGLDNKNECWYLN